ncbi:MAG: sulfurtransferase TusA family protein [Candidatus Nanopelagicales bacterium]
MTDSPAGGPTAGDRPVAWLDQRGQRCPIPIVTLARARRAYPPGSVVALVADDPGAQADVPAWCRLKGAELLGTTAPRDGGPGTAYLVRLPPGAP